MLTFEDVIRITKPRFTQTSCSQCGGEFGPGDSGYSHCDRHIADAAKEMLAALRLHQAWHDSEQAGPDYGTQSRDTHPDGERIWRRWWDNQLDLCERATEATRAAIAKATGAA